MKLTYIFPATLLAVLFCGLLNSCTDDFEEINSDPLLITRDQVNADAVFTYVLKPSVFSIVDYGRVGEYAGYVSNPASGFPLQNVFGSFADYRNGIINIEEVIWLTEEDPSLSNKNAIARIWKSWLYYRLTDNFGPVPYSEAARDYRAVITKPSYDSQEEIYRDILTTLSDAVSKLTSDQDQKSFGSADIIYDGDAESWKRFGNSLRLRLAMRVRYVEPSLASEHISELATSQLILTNEQNADVVSEGEESTINENRSPFYNSIQNNQDNPLHFSMTVSENLLKRDDPRLDIYMRPSNSAGYRSRPFNMVKEDQKPRYTGDSITSIGEYFRDAEYRFNVLTASEVHFLLSEASLAGIISGDTESYFQEGIRLALDQYDVSQSEIEAYLNSPAAKLEGSEEEKLEEIITQKYLANIYESHEAWAEYRRTGYPLMWIGEGPSDTGGEIPRRQKYPLDEYAKNKENVEQAASMLSKGDDPMSRVWWDAKEGVPFDHPRQGKFPPELY